MRSAKTTMRRVFYIKHLGTRRMRSAKTTMQRVFISGIWVQIVLQVPVSHRSHRRASKPVTTGIDPGCTDPGAKLISESSTVSNEDCGMGVYYAGPEEDLRNGLEDQSRRQFYVLPRTALTKLARMRTFVLFTSCCE
jgi:hypothetical protein